MLKNFGGKIPKELKEYERLEWLVKFSDIWDYRAKQNLTKKTTEENARWLIENENLSTEQEKEVFKVAKKLELIGKTAPKFNKYDYILVLGGARMSCLFRTTYAKELLENWNINTDRIVGLSGMRRIMQSERQETDTYR